MNFSRKPVRQFFSLAYHSNRLSEVYLMVYNTWVFNSVPRLLFNEIGLPVFICGKMQIIRIALCTTWKPFILAFERCAQQACIISRSAVIPGFQSLLFRTDKTLNTRIGLQNANYAKVKTEIEISQKALTTVSFWFDSVT